MSVGSSIWTGDSRQRTAGNLRQAWLTQKKEATEPHIWENAGGKWRVGIFSLIILTVLVKDKPFHEGKKSTELLVNKMRLFCLRRKKKDQWKETWECGPSFARNSYKMFTVILTSFHKNFLLCCFSYGDWDLSQSLTHVNQVLINIIIPESLC